MTIANDGGGEKCMESRCGILCGKCEWQKNGKCKGCVNIDNPFWGACPVKSCCEGRGLEHCGECSEFPCTRLEEFAYDENQGDCGVRLDQCKIWSAVRQMRYVWLDDYLMKKPGVTKLPPQWNWIRYAIGGKMFAAVCLSGKNEPKYITLKLEPEEGSFLRGQYDDIIPGYYMNKQHWNSVNPNGKIEDDLLKDLLDKSYNLVLGGFSRKKQSEILESAGEADGI